MNVALKQNIEVLHYKVFDTLKMNYLKLHVIFHCLTNF